MVGHVPLSQPIIYSDTLFFSQLRPSWSSHLSLKNLCLLIVLTQPRLSTMSQLIRVHQGERGEVHTHYFLQYNGSNDDLDWRIDFKYLNFICIIKCLRSTLIKGCSIEWIYLHLSNFNLRLDLIKTSFFKVLTYLIRSSEKFYIVLKKKISSIDPFLQVLWSF